MEKHEIYKDFDKEKVNEKDTRSVKINEVRFRMASNIIIMIIIIIIIILNNNLNVFRRK